MLEAQKDLSVWLQVVKALGDGLRGGLSREDAKSCDCRGAVERVSEVCPAQISLASGCICSITVGSVPADSSQWILS